MYSKRRHYKPDKVTWKKSAVTQTIKTIVDSVILQAESGEKWRKHPYDSVGGVNFSDFYSGRGGSLWAVDHLQRSGAVKTKFDVSTHLDQLIADNRKFRPKSAHPENSSYLWGEMPLLLMQYRIQPSATIAKEIEQAVEKNNTQPVRELMWGTAGSMLVALTMYRWTNEKRWVTAYRAQAKRMLSEWKRVKGAGYLWKVEFYDVEDYFLGPVHGFSGNALALIKGFDILTDKQVESICKRIMDTTVKNAVQDEKHANWWPRYTSEERDPKKKPLIQFCHGAPGMITPLASLPQGINTEFDSLLLKGGELIWDAGLLQKGPGLCHGTSGNGYAFLKLYQRTGDEVWLKRARVYAMHCIEQYNEFMAHYKVPRFPLWTGDPGIAIYLWDCVNANAEFPTLDVF